MMTLSDAADMMGGVHSGGDRLFESVCTDSRALENGGLFFAIVGDRVDGHDFLEQVRMSGAAGAVVSRRDSGARQTGSETPHDSPMSCHTNEAWSGELPTILVEDTTVALGRLGAGWRLKFAAQVVAITGSNGKTTVTALTAAILRQTGECLSPHKSFNNQWGVPLTLLKMRKKHRFVVIEMGTNHAGEIAYLTRLAMPNMVLINNVGQAHIEGLGCLDDIAAAKSEIYAGLQSAGTAVINADDGFCDFFLKAVERLNQAKGMSGQTAITENTSAGNKKHWRNIKVIRFSMQPSPQPTEAEVIGQNYREGVSSSTFDLTMAGKTKEKKTSEKKTSAVVLPLLGIHNAMNALAAAAICRGLGIDIETIVAGLQGASAVAGRLSLRRGANGSTVIDDSYNANPASIRAAINVLSKRSGDTLLVLGCMAELGADGVKLHREIGRVARKKGINQLAVAAPEGQELAREFAVGFGAGAQVFDGVEGLTQWLLQVITAASTVLVKGSRCAGMERVVEALCAGAHGTHGKVNLPEGQREGQGCKGALLC